MASNNLGILFTTYPNYTTDGDPLPNFAHVYSDTVYTDSLNWYKFEATYIADSAYSFMTLGNMFDVNHMNVLHLDSVATLAAFYYIDNVSISTDSLIGWQITEVPEAFHPSLINIYPNPANELLTIKNLNYSICEVRIYDISGKLVFRKNVKEQDDASINTLNIQDGMYFIDFVNKNEMVIEKRKVIITH